LSLVPLSPTACIGVCVLIKHILRHSTR
jgi:hypothetical protein